MGECGVSIPFCHFFTVGNVGGYGNTFVPPFSLVRSRSSIGTVHVREMDDGGSKNGGCANYFLKIPDYLL